MRHRDTEAQENITSDNRKVMTDQEQWVTPNQVAKEMQVSLRTVQRMCRMGELPAKKLGRQWRIEPDYKNQLAGAEEVH